MSMDTILFGFVVCLVFGPIALFLLYVAARLVTAAVVRSWNERKKG